MSNRVLAAYNLGKELIENNDKMDGLKEKIKGHKDCIKSFVERNEVVMGELRVHTEEGEADILSVKELPEGSYPGDDELATEEEY